MKMIKKCISVFLAVTFLLLSAAAGRADNKNDVAYALKITSENAAQAAEYLKTFASFDESSDKFIVLSVEGEALDYSVLYDESTGNVLLKGGCTQALMRAVNTFLSGALTKNGELSISGKINFKYDHSEDSVDNSALLKYEPADKNSLAVSWTDGLLKSPDWLDKLTMVEVRLDTASIGGTFDKAYDLLDFYARVGVNGIWLSPVYDRGTEGNGYGNFGPHTLDPAFTGTDDYEKGFRMLADFVSYAHSKGIYIFLDIISWGVMYNAPLIAEHPDWFSGEAWGNIAFDWSNEELRTWFTDNLVKNILVTDADGYRCDCEPNYTGYDIFGTVRERLAEKGKYIAIISEDTGTRKSVYDFEQDGVLDYSAMDRGTLYQNPVNFFTDGYLNIVDSVKTGKGIGSYSREENTIKRGTSKYYTNCITNHDYQKRNVCGNRLKIGYAAILAPFIPIWYMGDEFNASCADGVQYDIPVNFDNVNIPSNAYFLEDVKQMLKIRRTCGDIFEKWTLNHRNSNICEVKADGFDSLQNYARFNGNKAVIVIGNNKPDSYLGKVKIPFAKCGIANYKDYTVTDLMTGRVITGGDKKDVDGFTAFVPYQYVGIYLVEASGKTAGIDISGFTVCLKESVLSAFIKLCLIFD